MASLEDADYSFAVASGATGYPLKSSPAGTATAGSSDFITHSGFRLIGVFVEDGGTVAGVLTISDHAGTAGTAIVMEIPATDGIALPVGGSVGIKVPWTGIRAVCTGTGLRCRVIFRTN